MTKRLLTGAVLAAVLLGGAACTDSGTTATSPSATAPASAAASASSSGSADHAAACAQIKSSIMKAATDFLAAVTAAGNANDPQAASKAAQAALSAYASAAASANSALASDPQVQAALADLQTVMQRKATQLVTVKDQAGLQQALNDPELNRVVQELQTLCPAS